MAAYVYNKKCAVPMCKSASNDNPEKLFICVPKCPKRRRQWLQLARRDTKFISDKATVFFCEDHFDLPNDMENYTQYKLMGNVEKKRMKPGCLPTKFDCQVDRKRRLPSSTVTRPFILKRQRIELIKEAENSLRIPEDSNDGPEQPTDTVVPKPEQKSVPSTVTQPLILKRRHFKLIKVAESSSQSPENSNKHKRCITIAPKVDNRTNRNNLLTTPVKPVSHNSHFDSIQCCHCKNPIPGFVYSCLECNYDMCHLCNIDSVHAHHYILRGPFGRNSAEVNFVKKKVKQILKPTDCRTELQPDMNDKIFPMPDNIKKEQDLNTSDVVIKTEIEIEEHDPLDQLDTMQQTTFTDNYIYIEPFVDTNVAILPDQDPEIEPEM